MTGDQPMPPSATLLDGLSADAWDVCSRLWWDSFLVVRARIANELAAKGLAKLGGRYTVGRRRYCGVIRAFLPCEPGTGEKNRAILNNLNAKQRHRDRRQLPRGNRA